MKMSPKAFTCKYCPCSVCIGDVTRVDVSTRKFIFVPLLTSPHVKMFAPPTAVAEWPWRFAAEHGVVKLVPGHGGSISTGSKCKGVHVLGYRPMNVA